MTKADLKKIILLLRKFYETERDRRWIYEVITNARFIFKDHWNQKYFENLFDLEVYLDHDIFLKYIKNKKSICETIKYDLQQISKILIDKINLLPDYENMDISGSEIRTIRTDWEEINIGQKKLIQQLERSTDSIDFQNIGNSSRTIIKQLANEVFKPGIHIPKDRKIDISPGRYKNQLHTYIKCELSGATNKELRLFAESAIEMVEKSINLANSLTHKIGAERSIAEACVVSIISTISIIKLVENSKNTK